MAIDAGNANECPITDGRGVPRPQDGDGDFFVQCDIGSFERTPGLDFGGGGGGGCTLDGHGDNSMGWLALLLGGGLLWRWRRRAEQGNS